MMEFKEHFYGQFFHWPKSLLHQTFLSKLCSSGTEQPEFNILVRELYDFLLSSIVNESFKSKEGKILTRMGKDHPEEAILTEEVIDTSQCVRVANLLRAGSVPSQVFFDRLTQVFGSHRIRLDHFLMSRKTGKGDKVTGTETGGVKWSSDQVPDILLIPDPMGATGNTVVETVNLYKKKYPKSKIQFVAAHLIVTPEYLRRVNAKAPDLKVFALRVDRGLSEMDILNLPYGKKWKSEKGLNKNSYIVPGAGGIGELMNNAEY